MRSLAGPVLAPKAAGALGGVARRPPGLAAPKGGLGPLAVGMVRRPDSSGILQTGQNVLLLGCLALRQ